MACSKLNNGTFKMPASEFPDLSLLCLPGQRLCRYDSVKGVEVGNFPGLSRWALNGIMGVLKRERVRETLLQKRQRRSGDGSKEWNDVATGRG